MTRSDFQAGFHTISGALRTPSNVTTLRLPAYSPELNPVENLWHHLKSHYWSNRVYDDDEALEEAAVLDACLMQTICDAPYIDRDAFQENAYEGKKWANFTCHTLPTDGKRKNGDKP